MIKKKMLIGCLCFVLVISTIIASGCYDNNQLGAEIELGTISNISNSSVGFDGYTSDHIDSKETLISVLNESDYLKTDEELGECEALCITFYDKNHNLTNSVYYAVEYQTENMYAIYNDQIYKVLNAEKIQKEIGKYLRKDKYVIFKRSLEFEKEILDDGSIVYETAVCRTKRFFCNNESENQSLMFPQDTMKTPNSVMALDKYSVSKIAADIVGVKQFRSRPYYDEYTNMWLVNIMDEAKYQQTILEAEKNGSELICYDVTWDVVIDSTGNVVYYTIPY